MNRKDLADYLPFQPPPYRVCYSALPSRRQR